MHFDVNTNIQAILSSKHIDQWLSKRLPQNSVLI